MDHPAGPDFTVTFLDINLPDSTSNEPGSHGFFSYSILVVDGVLPFTRIENEVPSIFDFPNPHHHQPDGTPRRNCEWRKCLHHLCPGGIYLSQTVEQDTVLRQLFATPEQDSIVWHHINVFTVEDTEVIVTRCAWGVAGHSHHRDTMITLRLEEFIGL